MHVNRVWQRFVPLDGCLNFRDLGGYPTADGRMLRRGQVFRSDALHLLTPADVAHLRDELRIGLILDLRGAAELRSEGRGPLADEPIRFQHLPLFSDEARERGGAAAYEMSLADRYFLLARFAMQPIARVLGAIADADAPLVYHCAAGKDRTGVVTALLLSLLGVDDEIIAADYALTKANLDAIVERLTAAEGYQEMLEALPPDTLHAEPHTMHDFLDKLRAEYGSVRGYADAAGVAPATIQRLGTRLIE